MSLQYVSHSWTLNEKKNDTKRWKETEMVNGLCDIWNSVSNLCCVLCAVESFVEKKNNQIKFAIPISVEKRPKPQILICKFSHWIQILFCLLKFHFDQISCFSFAGKRSKRFPEKIEMKFEYTIDFIVMYFCMCSFPTHFP